jgi:carbon-monoxide dehydrogenase large subunit
MSPAPRFVGVRLDAAEAQKRPGTFLVLTADDLAGTLAPKPLILAPPNTTNPRRLPLAGDRVRFVGDGTSPHGQGTATTFAQIVADALGVAPPDVTVLHGDTAVVPQGFGTGGSRAASVGGAAVLLAARTVQDKARHIAAHLLEAAAADVEADGGRFHVRGFPGRSLGLAEIARVAHRGQQIPPDVEPGLEAARVYDPSDFTIPFGVYLALVEVAPDTGVITLHRFVGVDDVGTVINPLLLEGQLHGGIAQGVAQALWEEIVYDEAGQLLSGSLMDYAAPRADGLPAFELDRTVTPTPVNPLGAKGAGEAGCVGAPQAIVNAWWTPWRPSASATLTCRSVLRSSGVGCSRGERRLRRIISARLED